MKKALLIMLLAGFSVSIYSQLASEYYRSTMPEVVPPTPQSQIFERYVNHAITEYNGLPQIEIPLYEIKVKGLTIPISLSYHGGGVKYNRLGYSGGNLQTHQFDGDVGVGWSIGAGGYRITRTINGKPDEQGLFYDEADFNDHLTGSVGEMDKFLMGMIYYGNPPKSSTYADRDGEYDMYTYMMPSTTGHFFKSREGIQIVERNSDKIFTNIFPTGIVDNNGFKYLVDNNVCENTTLRIPNGTISAITAWPLQSIISPYNETINFTYDSFNYSDFSTSISIEEPYTMANGSIGHPSSIGANLKIHDYRILSYRYYEEKLITSITTDKEVVRFFRGENGLPANLVSKIEIRDKNNNLIKKILFDYQLPTNENWHCQLKSIRIMEESRLEKRYSFDYYAAPDCGFSRTFPDQWGYYAVNPNHSSGQDIAKSAFIHSEFLDYNIINYININGTVEIKQIKNSGEANTFRKYTADRSANNLTPQYFSLKKITFPTGGTTEYIYEANQYNKVCNDNIGRIIKGGGQRVKEIISKSEPDAEPIITKYKYGEGENGNGIANFNIQPHHFVSKSINVSYVPWVEVYAPRSGFSAVKTFSTSPVLPELSAFCVNYDKVTKYEFKESDNSLNGKTVSQYKIPIQYKENYKFNITAPIHNIRGVDIFYSSDWCPTIINEYKIGFKPVIFKRQVFKANTKILEESFDYQTLGLMAYNGVKVEELVKFSQEHYDAPSEANPGTLFNPLWVYHHVNRSMGYSQYKVYTGTEVLASKTTTSYDENGLNPLNTTENYTYDSKLRITKTTQTNSQSNALERSFTYPTAGTTLDSKNMVSIIIETVTKNNNKEIGRIKNFYNNPKILPDSVQASASGPNNLRTEIKYDRYDTKGNLQQYTTLDGLSTVILWAYKGLYPVAEIKNATYTQVNTAVAAAGLVSIDALSDNMNPAQASLASLSSRLPNAIVNTYTYKMFAGMQTVSDQRGVNNATYEYDSFNRLTTIKDAGLKKVSSYNYNYVSPYEPLSATVRSHQNTYPYKGSATFTINPSNGSGTYKYRWVLKNASNTIISANDNSSSQFSVSFPQLGRMTLVTTTEDVETGHTYEASSAFDVKKEIKFTDITNSSYNSSGYIEVDAPMTVTFMVMFYNQSGSSSNPTPSFKVGNQTLSLGTGGTAKSHTITLPAGRTKCTVSISGLYSSSYTYAQLYVYPPSGVVMGNPCELKAAYQY